MLYAGSSAWMSSIPFLIFFSFASFSPSCAEIILYFYLSYALSFMSFSFYEYVLSSYSLSSSWTCIWTIYNVSFGIPMRSTSMNHAYSTWILDGSLTLMGKIWITWVPPYIVESPRGLPKVISVRFWSCDAHSISVFNSTICITRALFNVVCELTSIVIGGSKDSCTRVAILS